MALACAAMALLIGAQDSEAATAQKLCFRNVTGVPYSPGPPTIDGDIANDLGWTGAFRYEFGNGVNQPHAVVQGNRDGSNVYLSFEVNNDSAFEDEDVLVLTFDIGTSPNRYRRLHLYPLFAGAGAAANNRLREAQLWRSDTLDGSGKVVWGTVTTVPNATLAGPAGFWLDAKVRSTDGGVGHRSWNVELRIPVDDGTSAINFPPASDFKMFLDVFRVDGLVASTPLLQWPGNAPAPANFIELESATPPVASWGAGSFGTGGCGGVNFAWNDINTTNTPTSQINLTGPNTFNVTLHNSSVDDSGAAISAKNIRATLKIANFGIPAYGSWTQVPSANNPTPSLDVPASSTATLSAGPWTLTPTQVTDYTARKHQCVLAELDSGDPRTLFTNRSAWRNMDFGTASTFERTAEIGTKGYKLPREYKAHRIDVVAETEFRVIERGDNEKRTQSELTWAFHGYRHLGRYVVINKKKFEVVEPVGSFGYIIRHALEEGAPIPDPVSTWQLTVKGIELNPLVREQQQYPKVRYYQADIVDGDALQIATVADYPEKPGTKPDAGTGEPWDGGTGGPGDGGTGNPPPVDGCGCRRSSPGGALGLLGLVMVGLLSSRRRGRRGDA